MPVHEVTMPDGSKGYQWGKSGKKYKTRAEAEKQAEAIYANGYAGDTFALDRSPANRFYDDDKRLHVRENNISKANVCEYLGAEIMGGALNGRTLSLDPGRRYKLYRHPDALKQAAETANNIQLVLEHIAVSVENPQHERVVGSLGSEARFEHPYLKNSLSVWDAEAIKGVEDRTCAELSMGYRYTVKMTPGTSLEGEDYDGVMDDISFNHAALVPLGRAGHDVMVGDSRPREFSMVTKGEALEKLCASFEAQAAAMATDAALAPVRKTILALAADAKKARDEMEPEEAESEAEDGELEPFRNKIAKGEDESSEEKKDEEDAVGKSAKDRKARDKKAADAKAAADRKAKDESDKEEKKEKEAEDRKAMDAAIQVGVSQGIAAERARLDAIRAAERDVRPYVGEIAIACDSAAGVYQTALKLRGVSTKITDIDGLKTMLSLTARAAEPQRGGLAMDAATIKSTVELFPGLARLMN